MEVNTKFNVGDKVWLVESNKVVMGLINTLVINWEGDTVDKNTPPMAAIIFRSTSYLKQRTNS